MSAWAAPQRLVLGQKATDAKSNLAMIGMVETKVERGGNVQSEKRYDLSSTKLDAMTFANAVRTPGHIEKKPHWTLDVVHHDDLVRLRTGYGSETMAVIRHCAMNLARAADDKHSLKVHRRKANLDTAYLVKLLTSADAST